ncbi:MAG: type II toxin-antitoxin system MqsA family antitoxin [Acidobacteria bacterium]|nr:type II toxin-antitoxin system MqsA family antitoxin [Acidobacteriota bacterium]
MRCHICKHGETRPGKTTLTLERGTTTLVFKNVPASVCANCEEAYIEEKLSARLMLAVEEAARSGVLVDVREYAPVPA